MKVHNKDVSVVVPCLNEEVNVPILAERLFAAFEGTGVAVEVLFVDDGSTDTTWQVIGAQSEKWGGRVRGVQHPANRGIPAAWRSGLDASEGAFVCLIDGDLQNPPEQVLTLYRRLVEGHADLAQGIRSSFGRLHDSRMLLSRGLNGLLNFCFGTNSRDSKSGFVLAPRSVMDDLLTYRKRYRHYQTFIGVAAAAKGYSVVEVETLFDDRNAGQSFLAKRAIRVTIQALLDFFPAMREFRFGAHPRHGANAGLPGSMAEKVPHPYRGWRRLWFEAYFLTFPAHKWMIRRRAKLLYLELRQTERMSRKQLDDMQDRRLRRLIQHAYTHVPYYRSRMIEAGIRPEDIRCVADLGRLPMLGKDDVRNHLYFDLFADNHVKREMQKISTSGSTGEPFTTYADRHQLEMRFATTLRALEWTGWRMGDRQARLWHQKLGMSKSQVIRERIDAFFMRRIFIPAFEISPENLESFVDKIRSHNPVLVDGYAESLNFLASYVREGGKAGFSPHAMMSSAQALPDNVRDDIEAGFHTRVYDKYGSREFSGIAYQCESSRDHHVMDESYIVELLVDGRPALPGEIGEIVITDLHNFSVPLIRYRIGDLAVALDQSQPCECGRHLSRIGRIEGRTQAIVHCGNGVWIPGTFFAHFFKDYEHIVRFFQVVQDEPGRFNLLFVRNRQFSETVYHEMLAALREYVGDETEITTEFVDEIPLVRTGKRSPVVSTVRYDFQSVGAPRRSVKPR